MRFRLSNLLPVLFFVCCFCSNLSAQPHSKSLFFSATRDGTPSITWIDHTGSVNVLRVSAEEWLTMRLERGMNGPDLIFSTARDGSPIIYYKDDFNESQAMRVNTDTWIRWKRIEEKQIEKTIALNKLKDTRKKLLPEFNKLIQFLESKINKTELDSYSKQFQTDPNSAITNLRDLKNIEDEKIKADLDKISSGTGFFISNKSDVLTAYHVIKDAKTIKVTDFNGNIASATVTIAMPNLDIAILHLKYDALNENTKQIPFLRIHSKPNLNIGDKVFTIGFPIPDILGRDAKYTEGTVSGTTGFGDDKSHIQISVPIQPGNSGGPLINEQGEVIGLVVSTLAAKKYWDQTDTFPQNVNFAIRSDSFYPFISALIATPSKELNTTKKTIEEATQSVCYIEVGYKHDVVIEPVEIEVLTPLLEYPESLIR
jgi:S1-C subfamily serine protease